MTTGTHHTSDSKPRVPATVLVLLAIASVQFGGALAVTLIPLVGVLGSVTLRLAIASAIMLAILRPKVRGHSRGDWCTVAAFGVALAAMNSAFYASLERLPIGIAVTVEFVGPLMLAAVLSRRARDLIAVAIAAVGILLISGIGPTPVDRLDIVGVALALTAGAAWAAYILLSARTGARFPHLDGLAFAMTIATVLVAPMGIATAGASMLEPEVLLRGAGIAVLSSVLPYSLELLALRHLRANVFGVLLSLEPAVAALAGLVVLGQVLSVIQMLGMAAVVAASASVTRREPTPPPDPDTPRDLGP
ncbi:EamA family transporter [Mobilicoccus caccae]|uniref:Membrane protein n=1 Tax=Mobilicoccus caccae TaxID=1859295 RepID=A0ABQ6IQV6_9MICO|nr:EamA family transporter [Mobilicoccus caccae]GMA39466.1 membrane protein [Mobilicoccus caccae]